MRLRLLPVALVLLLTAPALLASDSVPPGFVTRIGSKLFLDGTPYRFDGLNIYNANSRNNCWYTMAGTKVLDSSLNDIGPNKVFRAWFYQSLALRGGARDWSAFDQTLAVARAHGYHVVFTLADQGGTCEAQPPQQPLYKGISWYQWGYKTQLDYAQYTETYRDWVREVVTRYKNDPTILMWQLMNEAEALNSSGGVCAGGGAPAAAIAAFADDMGAMIKSIDLWHLISLGTLGGGQCGVSDLDYATVHASQYIDLCEYHDYGDNTHPIPGGPNGLQHRINQAKVLNKPLFVGEAGIQGDNTIRGQKFAAKMSAQFGAGVQGFLMWAWRDQAHGGSDTGYDIGPTDPAIPLLTKY